MVNSIVIYLFCTHLTFDLILRLRRISRLGIYPCGCWHSSRNTISMDATFYPILPSEEFFHGMDCQLLGRHNQGIIAFNLVTHIVYYDTTTETGQAMLRGASVHASRGDLQQSRHRYLQLGDRLQMIAWPYFLYLLIYGRAYPRVLVPPKIKLLFWILLFFLLSTLHIFGINISICPVFVARNYFYLTDRSFFDIFLFLFSFLV